MEATIRVPDAVGVIDIVTDLESRLVTTSAHVAAPKEGYAKTRINWLLRQLRNAPNNIRVTVRYPRVRTKTSLLISDARSDPAALLLEADRKREPSAFDVALVRKTGGKRGKGRGSFVDLAGDQVTDFYRDVVQKIRAWTPKAPRLPQQSEESDLPSRPADPAAATDPTEASMRGPGSGEPGG